MSIINDKRKGKTNRDLRQMSLLAMIPAILVTAPLVGYFGGHWLDQKFETEPVLMISGVILGFAAAGLEIAQLVKKSSAMTEEDHLYTE